MDGFKRSKHSPLIDVIVMALAFLALMCLTEYLRAQSAPQSDAHSSDASVNLTNPDAPGGRSGNLRDSAENRAFWITTGIDFAATFIDAAVSSRSHFEPGVGHCHEGNPLLGGPYPSTARLWLGMSAATAGIAVVSYVLKRRHHDWFVMLPLGDAIVHASFAGETAGRCLP